MESLEINHFQSCGEHLVSFGKIMELSSRSHSRWVAILSLAEAEKFIAGLQSHVDAAKAERAAAKAAGGAP